MNPGSLRTRVVLSTVTVLVLGLSAFAVFVTERYRSGLESGISTRLVSAARLLADAPAQQVKQLQHSLALEGIDVTIASAPPQVDKPAGGTPPSSLPVKPVTVSARGALLVVTEPLGGRERVAIASLTASRAGVSDAVGRLVLAEGLGAALVLCLGIGLTFLLLNRALRPLAHVARVAQIIAAGDRDRRLKPRRVDTELGRMAASFDAMVDALEEAARQAQQSESAMRRFLADASHELRTPVASVQATAEALLREQPERPERDHLEARLAGTASRLGRLVDDLLNLARLEANEPMRVLPVDLAEVTRTVIAEASLRGPHARVELIHQESAMVSGDRDALGRAVRNLVDNAITATSDTGCVTLEVRRGQSEATVVVADDGPGIPVGARERIFHGFVRLPGSAGAGVGLGLAIAQRVAHQHRGAITCEDAGSGARFVLRVPLAAQPSAAENGDDAAGS